KRRASRARPRERQPQQGRRGARCQPSDALRLDAPFRSQVELFARFPLPRTDKMTTNAVRNLCCVLTALLAVAVLTGCGRSDPSAFIASAKGYMAKADYYSGIIQLKSALQQAPDNAEARFLLAESLLASGDPAAAEAEVRKAADLNYPADDA